MKKILTILTAALLLGAGLLVSCKEEGDEIINELAGPTNTWCEIPVYITTEETSNSKPDLYLDLIFCATDYAKKSGSANLGVDLKAGITVVAHASIELESLGMSAGSYVVKNFPLNGSSNDTDDNDSYSFTGSKAKWTALYWSKKAMRDTNTQIDLPKAPTPVCNTNTGYTQLTDLSKFSWKKLLANYLLDNL